MLCNKNNVGKCCQINEINKISDLDFLSALLKYFRSIFLNIKEIFILCLKTVDGVFQSIFCRNLRDELIWHTLLNCQRHQFVIENFIE